MRKGIDFYCLYSIQLEEVFYFLDNLPNSYATSCELSFTIESTLGAALCGDARRGRHQVCSNGRSPDDVAQ